jgi:hypothetical protein
MCESRFFFQFSQVGELAIIQMMNEPNLAKAQTRK